MSKANHLNYLLEQYLQGIITRDELAEFYQYMEDNRLQEILDGVIHDYFTSAPDRLHTNSEKVGELAWQNITAQIEDSKPTVKLRLTMPLKLIAAAAAVVIISLTIFYFNPLGPKKDAVSIAVTRDLPPGTHRATLQAANGKIYQLGGSEKEIIAEEKAIRYQDGSILEAESGVQNFVLSTPKGGQYKITLADGTEAWLNAASSLSYPNRFIGKERRVIVQGEVYFEVTHNARQPFIVQTAKQEIKVLGTTFNVNAYPDEGKTVTTLVNGLVKLDQLNGTKTAFLYPGEQSVLEQQVFEVSPVDVSLYTAWKDGEFRFKATPLIAVLHQVERWYNLDIDYENIPQDIQIHASIRRDKPLSAVITALEKVTNLKFEIKGRSMKLMK